MADQERVTIKINVRADTSAIDRVQRKLAAMCAQAEACEKTFSDLNDRFDAMEKRQRSLNKSISDNDKELRKYNKTTKDAERDTDRYNRSHNRLNRTFGAGKKGAKGLQGMMKLLTFAFKAAGIETLAYAAALSSVNLLLKTGQLLSRGYQASVRGVGVAAANAAAGVAALAATFAAAMRQFAAAQSVGSYGGQFASASRGLRAMQGDAQLAVFGVQALTGAFAAASKNARVTGQTVTGLRGLADFAATSGDMEKGLQAAAQVISLLQAGKAAGGEQMLSAAKELGPEFEKSYKAMVEGGKKSNEEIIAAISSGELARQAGIEGAAGTVSGTLIGQLKSFGTEIQVLFGDIGNNFLPQVQEAFEDIRRIIFRTVVSITGNLQAFASGPFVETLVGAIDKLGLFTAKLFNEYLPKTEEVMTNFVNGWRRFTGFFSDTSERFSKFLNEFSEASSVINEFFGEILRAIGGGLSQGFENFADLVVDNKEQLLEFGSALGGLIDNIFELFRAIREAFFKVLPVITQIVDVISALVAGLSNLIGTLGALGPAGAAAGLALPFVGRAAAGRGRVGQFMRSGVAGRATGALAVGAGSYMAGSAIGNFVMRSGGGSSGAVLGGAGGGALAGAAIGSVIPGLGTAVGAIGGAIVGGIAGYFGGESFKNDIKDAASNFAQGYGEQIQDIFVSRNYFNAAEDRMAEFSSIAYDVANGLAESELFTQEGARQWLEESGKLNDSIDLGRRRSRDLAKMLGMTEGEIQSVARAAGVDLSDKFMSLQDIMVETGLVVGKWGEEFNATISNAFASSLSNVRQRRALIESEAAIDEVTRTFAEKVAAGAVTDEDRLAVIEAAGVQASLVGEGDPLRALQYFAANIGEGGVQFGAGGALAGMQGDLLAGVGGQAIQDVIGGTSGAVIDQLLANVITEATAIGVAVDAGSIRSQLESMGVSELVQAADILRDQKIQENFATERALGVASPQLAVSTVLENAGLKVDELGLLETEKEQQKLFFEDMAQMFGDDMIDPFDQAVDKFNTAIDDFRTTIQQEFGSNGGFWASFGEGLGKIGSFLNPVDGDTWFDDGNWLGWANPFNWGDTATSRYDQTLSTHSRLSGGIAGKRTITSGLRSFNLGSMSSDHATGNAIDMVGNNLGLYQQAMKNAGGYAEFHGGTNSRHLHVVPPHGDTYSPANVSSGMGGGASTINVTVNAAPGMNEEAVAMAVARRIERQQQMMRERS